MTRLHVALTLTWHVLLWPLPHRDEPQLDPDVHPWVEWLCWLRTGHRRWVVAWLWLGIGMTTAGITLYLPILRDRTDVLAAGGAW